MICFQWGMKAQVIFVCSKLWLSLFFFFFFWPHCMQDLCSLTRDQTHTPWIPRANLEYKHEDIYSSLCYQRCENPLYGFLQSVKIRSERWWLRWSVQGEWNLHMKTDYIKFLKSPGCWTTDWNNCHLIPWVGFIFIYTHEES